MAMQDLVVWASTTVHTVFMQSLDEDNGNVFYLVSRETRAKGSDVVYGISDRIRVMYECFTATMASLRPVPLVRSRWYKANAVSALFPPDIVQAIRAFYMPAKIVTLFQDNMMSKFHLLCMIMAHGVACMCM